MASEQKVLSVPKGVSEFQADFIRRGVKVLEVKDFVEANAIEATGNYYIDRFSDSRNCYILMRRERK